MQSMKRNADVAFESTPDTSASKKRRRRRKGRNETLKPDTETKTPIITSAADTKSGQNKISPAENQKKSSEISTTTSFEDQITIPELSSRNIVDSEITKRNQQKKSEREGRPDRKALPEDGGDSRSSIKKWDLSSISGGAFIDQDPILTADAKFLILPTKYCINVYSTSTSLLVRSISVRDDDTILCVTITENIPNTLLAATRRGYLMEVDFVTGSKTRHWKIEISFKCVTSLQNEGSQRSLLAITSKSGQDDELCLLSLDSGGNFQVTKLLRSNNLQNAISTSSDASVIVVCSVSHVHIGLRTSDHTSSYTWHNVSVESNITCFDMRVRGSVGNRNAKVPTVSLAIGLENGSIFIYENVVQQLQKSLNGAQKLDLTNRKLHWHRNQVKSVKWSRDGNYVISGGEESVLVIWQLETSQQQFLPHLSTPILNITVSAVGAHYALRLGDNSVMVLSTADLSPSANISGFIPPSNTARSHQMQLHPAFPSRLLSAVSIRPSDLHSMSPATHLQIYDIDTGLQISRQALTRNVTTVVNVAPEGQPIQEPDVTHFQISSDGKWLATVDTWSPTTTETQALYLMEGDDIPRRMHSETTLRFWGRRNTDDSSWDVVTRIDGPHAAARFSVLALASNPVATEFSTMGMDGLIRIWRPRRRIRDGVQVRDTSGQPLFTWICSRTVTVEDSGLTSTITEQPLGILVYSNDASVLAASWSRKNRHVHLIDSQSGSLCMSLPHLVPEGHANIAIMGRFLLCLSSNFRIFDMVSLHTTFAMPVKQNRNSFLSVNHHNNSFVIGTNPNKKARPASLSLFMLENAEQGSITDCELQGQIQALIAEPVRGGYIVVDKDSRIHKLLPTNSHSSSSIALKPLPVATKGSSTRTLEDIMGPGNQNLIQSARHQENNDNENYSRNLNDVLAVPTTTAQFGISELFDRVSKAVSGLDLRVVA